MHILDPLDFFPENMGGVSDENVEGKSSPVMLAK